LCKNKDKIDVTEILEKFYDLEKVLYPNIDDFCAIPKPSRNEIASNLLGISNADGVFNEFDKFCSASSNDHSATTWGDRSEFLKVLEGSITEALRKRCGDILFWKTITNKVVDHKNCIFLTIKNACTQVILDPDVLREKEVNEIKALMTKLEKILADIGNFTKNTLPKYESINKSLKSYETKIESFANFQTIPIAVFRSFTMFVGELDSSNFNEPLRMIMLLLFIFFMVITLQNLMNSIALIDAQEIINEAQIIGIKKRISLVHSYQKFFEIFKDRFALFSRKHLNRYLLTPSKSRQLVLFDPLNIHENKTDKLLVLSKDSLEKLKNFLDNKE
jgi:hypothetical protein